MPSGVAASDVIRSMMREGFSHEEVYDVLTGTGLPGEQVQLLIDRVAAEFHEAGLESRPSRLAAEVEKAFLRTVEDLQHATLTRMESLARQLDLVKVELGKMRIRTARRR